jgi:hypothetical protein
LWGCGRRIGAGHLGDGGAGCGGARARSHGSEYSMLDVQTLARVIFKDRKWGSVTVASVANLYAVALTLALSLSRNLSIYLLVIVGNNGEP